MYPPSNARSAGGRRSTRPRNSPSKRVEREGVLDGEAVRRAGDDREVGAGDVVGELFAVGRRREDVLAARHHERRHPHLDEPIAQRVVGVEDRAGLRRERVRGNVERERAEHTEGRPVAA